jgi:hypothetical protein
MTRAATAPSGATLPPIALFRGRAPGLILGLRCDGSDATAQMRRLLEHPKIRAIFASMKLNSAESIAAANTVFQGYEGSWTAAREAAHRAPDGVLVIPKPQTAPREAGARAEGPRSRTPG